MGLATTIIVFLVLWAIFFGGFKFFMWLKEKRLEKQEEATLQ